MQIKTKRLLNKLLAKSGIYARTARGAKPVDLTGCREIDPISASYRAAGRPVLIKVPLSRLVTFGYAAFNLDASGTNPFVRTLTAYFQGRCDAYDNSPLREFYMRYQPESAAGIVGLSSPSYRPLLALPPSAAPKAWMDEHPESLVPQRTHQLEQDNREHARKLNGLVGDPFFGPVSEAKGRLEFRRLTRISVAIREHGFRIDPFGFDNTAVIAFVDDSDWRLMVVHSGQHRVASLAALGHKDVVVQLLPSIGIGGLVLKSHAWCWPGVSNGYFSEAEALAIFERVKMGRQPDAARTWQDFARET